MAVLLKITMRRANAAGINCKSTRPIVILSEVPQGTMDKLESALGEAREIYSDQAFVKSQSAIITEVCNKILGRDNWQFTVQGGEIEF